MVRVAPGMEPQHVANTWWAYATLDLFPSSWDAYNSHLTQMLRPTIAVAAADGYLR